MNRSVVVLFLLVIALFLSGSLPAVTQDTILKEATFAVR